MATVDLTALNAIISKAQAAIKTKTNCKDCVIDRIELNGMMTGEGDGSGVAYPIRIVIKDLDTDTPSIVPFLVNQGGANRPQ